MGAQESQLNRRQAMGGAAASSLLASAAATTELATEGRANTGRGRLNQSFCRWCFGMYSLEELAIQAVKLGLAGIDLLNPDEFATVKSHGLVCTMVNSHPLEDGLCDPQFHSMCLEKLQQAIEATAKEGWRNVICFSGNGRGIDREAGMNHCVAALKRIVPEAERLGVVLCMELLNSRVDHPDYMCDRSSWGIELCKRVGSDHFKLLFDIYHMQIMEGDIIRTIQENHQYFGHYHTAGNPGRHELDATQELYYPPIAKAIADTGFAGYVAHEFVPTIDPFTGLAQAVEQFVV